MAFDYQPKDEVFHLHTRQIGVVVDVKEIAGPVSGTFLRVTMKPGLPDEIWALKDTALWIRQKRYLEPEKA